MQKDLARVSSRISMACAEHCIRRATLDVRAPAHFWRFFGPFRHLVIFRSRPALSCGLQSCRSDLSRARIRATLFVFGDFTLEICSTGGGDISSGIGSSGAEPTRTRGGLGAARTRVLSVAPLPYARGVYALDTSSGSCSEELGHAAARRDRRAAAAHGNVRRCSRSRVPRESACLAV